MVGKGTDGYTGERTDGIRVVKVGTAEQIGQRRGRGGADRSVFRVTDRRARRQVGGIVRRRQVDHHGGRGRECDAAAL